MVAPDWNAMNLKFQVCHAGATTEGRPYMKPALINLATALDGVACGSPPYAKLFNYETMSQNLTLDCHAVIDMDGQLFCAAGKQ